MSKIMKTSVIEFFKNIKGNSNKNINEMKINKKKSKVIGNNFKRW